MFKNSKPLKVFLAFFILVVGGYLLSRYSSADVPENFKEARVRGAMVAQDIVNISNSLSVELEKVSELNRERKFVDALNLTTELIKKNQEVRSKAVQLSAELEVMTSALSNIDSFEAKQAALESISNRLSLIARLVNYSDYLANLLDVLRSKFTNSPIYSPYDVPSWINKINDEVRAINDFNKKASEAMEKFDRIVK